VRLPQPKGAGGQQPLVVVFDKTRPMLRQTSSSKLLRRKTVASLPECGSANCQPCGKEINSVRRCHAHVASVAVWLE